MNWFLRYPVGFFVRAAEANESTTALKRARASGESWSNAATQSRCSSLFIAPAPLLVL
jgi:hypothetical protein